MLLDAEQLRAKWKQLDYPATFDPDQPNWTDLSITDLVIPLSQVLAEQRCYFYNLSQLDGELLDPSRYKPDPLAIDTPFEQTRIWKVRGINQLPPILQGYAKYGDFDEVLETNFYSPRRIAAVKFFDPRDRVYFSIGRESDTTAPQGAGAATIRLTHLGSLVSEEWRTHWGLQMDTVVNLTPYNQYLTQEMVSSLIPPQEVKDQLGAGTVGIVGRRSLYRSNDRYCPERYLGGNLLYSEIITVTREKYPFTDLERAQAIANLAESIRRSVLYDLEYRAAVLSLADAVETAKIRQKFQLDKIAARQA